MRYLPLVSISLLAGFFFSTTTTAQNVSFRAKVENTSGNNVHSIACTNTRLTSNTINLKAFHGLQVMIQGKVLRMGSSPLIQVNSIKGVARTFEIGGNAKIGREFSIHVAHIPGSFFATYLSGTGRSTLVPLGQLGVFFLRDAFLALTGRVPAGGVFQLKIKIPNDSRLVGLKILGQAAIVPANSRAVFLSNPSCKTVRSR